MTHDDGSHQPIWEVASLGDALAALRGELSARATSSAQSDGIEVSEVTAEFSAGLDRDKDGRLGWVVAISQADAPARDISCRITVRLARRNSTGSAGSSGSPWTIESTRGADNSLSYGTPGGSTSNPAPARGWDDGDPL
jgi:hypothetical protein